MPKVVFDDVRAKTNKNPKVIISWNFTWDKSVHDSWWLVSCILKDIDYFGYIYLQMEKEMATHSSVLAWRIPGTGEPSGLPSMGLHRVGHDWSDLAAAAAAAAYLQNQRAVD